MPATAKRILILLIAALAGSLGGPAQIIMGQATNGGGTPGGSTGNIQYKTVAGAFGADANLSYANSATDPVIRVGRDTSSMPDHTLVLEELGPAYLINARKNIGPVLGAFADSTHEAVVDGSNCSGRECVGFYYEVFTAYNSQASPVSVQIGQAFCDASYFNDGSKFMDDCGIEDSMTNKRLYFIDNVGNQPQTGSTEGDFWLHNLRVDGIAIVPLHTPASSTEACTAGQFSDDASFHYVCTATNTWKRVALSSF